MRARSFPCRLLVALLVAVGCHRAVAPDTGLPLVPPVFHCPESLRVVEMSTAMVGEENGDVFDTSVQYLSADDRRSREARVRDGLVVDAEGKPYDSGGEPAIFVLSPEGVLYMSLEAQRGKFHHSSFLAGQPVAGAGEMTIAGGRLETIGGHSGHYRPDHEMAMQFLCWLDGQGVSLDGVAFFPSQGDGPYPAASLIER